VGTAHPTSTLLAPVIRDVGGTCKSIYIRRECIERYVGAAYTLKLRLHRILSGMKKYFQKNLKKVLTIFFTLAILNKSLMSERERAQFGRRSNLENYIV
jgi:hypothetical protein